MASKHHFQLSPDKSRIRAEVFWGPKSLTLMHLLHKPKEKFQKSRLNVNDVLVNYSGELGVMMRWCESSEHERPTDVPPSIPLRSVGHVGGGANVCVYAKDGCTHNYPRRGGLPLPSTQISLRQLPLSPPFCHSRLGKKGRGGWHLVTSQQQFWA